LPSLTGIRQQKRLPLSGLHEQESGENMDENEVFYRTATIQRSGVSEKKRTVELSFSSEKPYERYFGLEILDHSQGAVVLDRLQNGGPLLVDHDTRDHVGIIEEVSIGSDRKGRALVRFGKAQRADEIFTDVVDGIRQNVSVGYRIHEMQQVEDSDVPTFRATKWEPLEISLVSVPADASVGVGRSYQKNEKEFKMTEPNKNSKEQKRINEITAYGEHFHCEKDAQQAILTGQPLDEFRSMILNRIKSAVKPIETGNAADLGLTDKEVRRFSILRALNAQANPQSREAQEAAAFEFEASAAYSQKIGKTPRGVMIPPDVLKRDLTAGTNTAGGYTVGTDLLADNFIELLRNRSVVMQAGATVLSGLQGDVAIPKMTDSATAYWIVENAAPTESQQTFGQLALSPHSVAAYTDLSRRLLIQSSPSMEQLVKSDLANILATAVDLAALHGSGAGAEPTGIASTSGIGSVAGGTNGLAPVYSHILSLETEIAQDNADTGNLAYVTNSKVRGKLKQAFTNSTYGEIPLWTAGNDGEGRLNGYRAFSTNQVSSTLTKGSSSGVCSAIFFGNWADLIIGTWSGIDILADPYSLSTTGALRITAFYDIDLGCRHPESFSAMLDCLTA